MDAHEEFIVAQLVPLVKQFRQNPHTELEARVGVKSPGHFQPGVSYAYYRALFDAMTDAASMRQWNSELKVDHFRYLYFRQHVRGLYTVNSPPLFVKVERVKVVDVHCDNRVYDLRFSLKRETPYPLETPPVVPPESVRINTRESLQSGMWRYDFTKTSMGNTTIAACGDYSIFIELEIQRNLDFESMTDTAVAINLLGRSVDLLGRYSQSGVEEKLKLRI